MPHIAIAVRDRMTPHFWGGVALVLAPMRPLGRMRALFKLDNHSGMSDIDE